MPDAPMFRVAVRRCRRARKRSNQYLESIGVMPDLLYLPTRNDLLNSDAELLEKAGSLPQKNVIKYKLRNIVCYMRHGFSK